MRLCILFTVLLAISIIAPPAFAQKLLPESKAKEETNLERWEQARLIFSQLPDEIQRELEAEARLMYQECNNKKSLSNYHDCECVSAHYLDERVLQGPDISKGLLQQAAQKECVNDAGVAGQNYEQCMVMDSRILPTGGLDQKDYCTCYANEMAKAYKDAPELESQYLKRMMAGAFARCQGTMAQ